MWSTRHREAVAARLFWEELVGNPTISVMSDFPLYSLSEEHQVVREAVRAICDAKVAPFAAEVDEEARYPREAAEALKAADFHAAHVPEAYGGAGADALATVIIIEEVARACVSSSLIPAVNKIGRSEEHTPELQPLMRTS